MIPTLLVYSQNTSDSLNLAYVSPFEKSIFQELNKGSDVKSALTDYFFALDSSYTSDKAENDRKKVDKFLQSLEKKVLKYNDKKRVKYIFDQVHNQFFRKYDIEAYFSDIFTSSTYNCVTGSALYSYAFQYFKIPFQIKETPTHVFLVAFPKKYNIYIETTVPGKIGTYTPTNAMIKNAVDKMIELKLVTSAEVAKKGYNKTFNDYYYGDENITPMELAGLQYYNKAVSSVNEENFKTAYESMQKSSVLYENKRSQLFLEGILGLLVDELDFTNFENFDWFIRLCHTLTEHDYLTYKLHSIVSNSSLPDKNRDIIEDKIENEKFSEELKIKLLEVVYVNRASRFDKQQQRKKAMVYAEKLFELNPKNLDAKNFIALYAINSLFQKNLGIERLDDLEILVTKYPFLETYGSYAQYQTYIYSYLVSDNFTKNRRTSGLKYLVLLENVLEENINEVDLNQELIGAAYAAVGAYFYRNQQVSKSVEYLKKGLKYSPENENISRKLRLIKNAN